MTSTSAYAVHCDVGLKESVHALAEQGTTFGISCSTSLILMGVGAGW